MAEARSNDEEMNEALKNDKLDIKARFNSEDQSATVILTGVSLSTVAL